MALILSIDTTTTVCSVALHQKGDLVALKELYLDKSHASHLLPIIDELLNNCTIHIGQIEAIAFSEGPGSYTGLRIGSSTVKGLCYSLGIPLIAISTLKAMALQINGVNNSHALLCPMLDARRMEVYTAFYDLDLNEIKTVQPVIIDEDSFQDYFINHEMYFFGNGSYKCKNIINKKSVFINNINPSAKTIGQLAYPKFLDQQFEDLAYYEPFYLKDFKATVPKSKLV